jgi:recombination protein RecA
MYSKPLSEFPRAVAREAGERISTGFPELDVLLGGGLPCGQILEISGESSSGKSTLAFGACLSLLQRGKAVAWVDPSQGFWPLAALEAKKPLDKLLVLRVKDGMAALRGAHLLLSSRGAVAAVVVTLPAGFSPAESNLVKLLRLAEQAGAALVFLTQRPATAASLGACVALRLCVRRAMRGKTSVLQVHVARHKHGPTRAHAEEPVRGPDRLRIRSTL